MNNPYAIATRILNEKLNFVLQGSEAKENKKHFEELRTACKDANEYFYYVGLIERVSRLWVRYV